MLLWNSKSIFELKTFVSPLHCLAALSLTQPGTADCSGRPGERCENLLLEGQTLSPVINTNHASSFSHTVTQSNAIMQ